MNNIINVTLSKLTAWKGNVRKTDADAGIDELAASIAAHGLLQSLVVRSDGKKGKYAVIAGRRRLLALKALAKAGTIEADADIPCRVAAADIDPTELSLAENVVRVPMHPADQFEAFSKLIDKGAGVADVAARFGVPESVVTKRMKLGKLSPVILAAYREEQIGLEQAQAFAISDDPEAQERAYEALSHGHMSPASIRRALTEGEIPADDRRVLFVGLEAYAEAGGAMRRDLFDQDGGYIIDEALLDRLVAEKLAGFASEVAAEGWKWTQTLPAIEYDTLSQFSRRYPERGELSEADQAEFDRLSAELERLSESEDDADYERIGEIEQLIEELNAKAETWPPLTLAIAGAVIALDRDGDVRIERGLVRKEDERILKAAEQSASGEPASAGGFALPATLVADLTAQKTAVIRHVLSQHPDIALATVVHTLALALLYPHSRVVETCLELKAPGADLRPDMAKPDACAALTAFEQDCERWAFPANPAEFWDWCIAQSREKLLELLALCVARSVNAVRRKGDRPGCDRLRHADMLARSLGIDMTTWFTPDAESYFARINRNGIFAAIREAKGTEPAPAWIKLKKSELAQIATRQVAGTGWLPEPVRIADRAELQTESDEAADFDDAESEAA